MSQSVFINPLYLFAVLSVVAVLVVGWFPCPFCAVVVPSLLFTGSYAFL